MGRLSAQVASWVIVLISPVALPVLAAGGGLKDLRGVLDQTRRTLEDGTSRDEPLPAEIVDPASRLSHAYAKAGEIDAPLELARRLPGADRLRAVCRVALERSTAGDPQTSVLFRQAFIEAGDDPEALARVAFYLMHAGRTAEARATLDRIDDPARRATAQISALSAQLQAGDLDGAEQTLRALHGPTARSAVEWGQVSTLAYGQARAGDTAAAMRTLEWETELVAPEKRPWQRDWTLSRIAEGQAARGEADAALRTAASIATGRMKRRAQLAAAVAQARAGDKQGALRTLQVSGAEDAIELGQKLLALALVGEYGQAMRGAAELQANGDRAAVYREVWLAATRAGDRAAAGEAERRIRQDVSGVSAALLMASLQRKAGLADLSRQTLADTRQQLAAEHEDHAYLAYWRVGLEQTLSGDADGAITWAAGESRRRCRAWALLGVAEGLGQQAGLRPFSNDGT